MTKKPEKQELSPEHKRLVPGGDENCPLCVLPVEELEHFHKLKTEKNWSYQKLGQWLRKHYGTSREPTVIAVHFRQHAFIGKNELLEKSNYPEVIKALLPLEKTVAIQTDEDIEQAYQQLVKIAHRFANDVYKLYDEVEAILKTKDIKEELDGLSALELLERVARLARESREQVREVSALRAPKVMVANLLERYMNAVIKEIGKILVVLCGEVHYTILEHLQAHNAVEAVPQEAFSDIFKRIGVEFRDRTLMVKRQQMAEALSALQEMEKII